MAPKYSDQEIVIERLKSRCHELEAQMAAYDRVLKQFFESPKPGDATLLNAPYFYSAPLFSFGTPGVNPDYLHFQIMPEYKSNQGRTDRTSVDTPRVKMSHLGLSARLILAVIEPK